MLFETWTVWKDGASADTSHINWPAKYGSTLAMAIWEAFDNES